MGKGTELEVDYFGEVVPVSEEEKQSSIRLAKFMAQPENRGKLAPLDDEQTRINDDFNYAIRHLSDPRRQPKPPKPMAENLRVLTRKKLGFPDSMDEQLSFCTAVHSAFDYLHRADGFIKLGDAVYLLDVTVNSAKGPEFGKASPETETRRKREVLIIPEIDERPEELQKLMEIYSTAMAVGLFLELSKEKRKELWNSTLPAEMKAAVLNRMFKLFGENNERTKEFLDLLDEEGKIDVLKSTHELDREAEKFLLVQLGKEKALPVIRENLSMAKRCRDYNLGYDIPMQETRVERTIVRRRMAA